MNETAAKSTGQAQGSQMRITTEERLLIQKVFKNNDPLLKLLRKVFLPELDPNAPIGGLIDLWMTVDVKDMSPEMALINIKARNTLIHHVDQQLMQLGLISSLEEETVEQIVERKKKDSSK